MWRNAERTKRQIMPMIQSSRSIIVFDTETTGLGKDAKIIEFGGIRYQITNEKLIATHKLELYVNPGEPLSEKITEITGITDDMLADAKNEEQCAPHIYQFLESADLWAGYNINFDIRMLDQMAARLNFDYKKKECLDVMSMARDMIPNDQVENYKLSTVVEYMFPETDLHFHSAFDDAKATAHCLAAFLIKYNENNAEKEDKVQVKLEWASYNENPHQRSQKRIKMKLSQGEYGDIFWDIVQHAWSCKSTPKARRMFADLDLKNLEQQVLNRYGWRYHADSMDILAVNWGREKRASK